MISIGEISFWYRTVNSSLRWWPYLQNNCSEQEISSRKYYAQVINVPKFLCNRNFKTIFTNTMRPIAYNRIFHLSNEFINKIRGCFSQCSIHNLSKAGKLMKVPECLALLLRRTGYCVSKRSYCQHRNKLVKFWFNNEKFFSNILLLVQLYVLVWWNILVLTGRELGSFFLRI